MKAFVAGATGYTGRNVVASLRDRDVHTVAHVRPGSRSAEELLPEFDEAGAQVSRAEWSPEAMRAALGEAEPDLVFALLGTTSKRGKRDGSTYESVDYGLTVMLIEACEALDHAPQFVYLSSAGAGGDRLNDYLQARARVEERLARSPLNALIARPSFITGEDRPEDRPAERIGALVVDSLLGGLAALGWTGPRDRYASMTGPELGEALVRLALDGRSAVFEADAIRATLD
ncbi:MAG: NAD(P)H-binding protein [Rhodothermales bacterium]|nr:NAD(P)H-binding protein [Rhodothermales bacterium]MBO6778013.1 NAD(P)H-binding protein [Rhodothermales bacterium]